MRGWVVLAAVLPSCGAFVETEGLTGGEPTDARPAGSADSGAVADGAAGDDSASASEGSTGDGSPGDGASGLDDASSDATPDGSVVIDTGAPDARTTCLPGAVPIAHSPARGTAAISRNGTGDVSWNQPANALNLDGASSSTNLGIGETSHELLITGFGVTLPASAVAITGIEVTVTRRCSDGQVKDSDLRLFKGGFPVGTAKSKGAFWPTSNAPTTYGAPSDLWNASLSLSGVESSDFGIAIRATSSGIDDGRIDDVYLTVFYCD